MSFNQVILICVGFSSVAAFRFSPRDLGGVISRYRNHRHRLSCPRVPNIPRRHLLTLMTTDDDDEIDLDALGDWRAFRMKLIDSAASSTVSSDGVTSIDGIDLTSPSVPMKEKKRPKSVSKRNEEVLMAQNEILGEEYLKGVWAHESALAEVGGLVCRMPLEAEINNPSCRLHYRFQVFLDSHPCDTVDETEAWYNSAKQFLQSEIDAISATADENGKIDPSDLDTKTTELLQLYLEQQQEWQNVCLVVEKDERSGEATTIAINRPMAFKLSESLARLVLLGAFQATQLDSNAVVVGKREQNASDTQLLVKFLAAFENECGVYVGGPQNMEAPATMIHGIPDIPGAVEISPGTGIYEGGVEAACDGVLSGKYKPLDFRFFIGHSRYSAKELDDAVRMGKYQPVACSRPLVLKQCIQLPKPLWHEVLEFCGGELEEISRLEFLKRDDLI